MLITQSVEWRCMVVVPDRHSAKVRVFLDCGRVGIPHLSLATNWDGIMRRSDESCHLDLTTRRRWGGPATDTR